MERGLDPFKLPAQDLLALIYWWAIEGTNKENRDKLDRALDTSGVRSDGVPDWVDEENDYEASADDELAATAMLSRFAKGE